MMSKGNTLVHFKLMLVILIVIISNILSALWVHSSLHIHHIVMCEPPQNISASSTYGKRLTLMDFRSKIITNILGEFIAFLFMFSHQSTQSLF